MTYLWVWNQNQTSTVQPFSLRESLPNWKLLYSMDLDCRIRLAARWAAQVSSCQRWVSARDVAPPATQGIGLNWGPVLEKPLTCTNIPLSPNMIFISNEKGRYRSTIWVTLSVHILQFIQNTWGTEKEKGKKKGKEKGSYVLETLKTQRSLLALRWLTN